jgi:hypothetical protein
MGSRPARAVENGDGERICILQSLEVARVQQRLDALLAAPRRCNRGDGDLSPAEAERTQASERLIELSEKRASSEPPSPRRTIQAPSLAGALLLAATGWASTGSSAVSAWATFGSGKASLARPASRTATMGVSSPSGRRFVASPSLIQRSCDRTSMLLKGVRSVAMKKPMSTPISWT